MRRSGGPLFLLLIAAACDSPNRLAAPPAISADRRASPEIVVHPGGSIQAAVNAAGPGAVIHIEAGTYAEAIHITTPGLKLLGQRGPEGAGVIIKNPGSAANGITVSAGADGFALKNVTVRGFKDNGVFLSGVNGFLLSGVTAQDDGEYGLFPSHSAHGLIERCRASGHNDTGIYVGQSHDVMVRKSVAFANVNGIEVENSTRVTVRENETYDNVVGILVVLLPGLDVTTTSDVRVAENRVHDNNHTNFAPPGDLASFVPSGSGILVVGAKRTTVTGNRVRGNQFTGIAVGSTLLLGALSGLPISGIDPDPKHVTVEHNAVTGNGGTSPIPFLPAVDLFWDGSGVDNCWSENRFTTSFPTKLPACD